MLLSLAALLIPSWASAQDPPAPLPVEPRAGFWCIELASPGGALRVPLVLRRRQQDGGWLARIEGAEPIDVPEVRYENGELVLDFTHYDATLRARVDAGSDGRKMSGRWSKRSSGGRVAELSFHGDWHPGELADRPPDQGPFTCSSKPRTVGPELFTGRFAVRFSDSTDPAVGIFEANPDGSVKGTFLTTTGDYRFLQGPIEGDTLHLYAFDGAHVFLFTARADAEGRLAGDFWSGDRHHETWSAVRDVAAHLSDSYAQVKAQDDFGLALRLFPDLEGRERSLAEPAFAGKARIVQVLGSWCPNCHDETALLADLDRRYRARGLSIVGLAFENSADPARSARQVQRMRARHGAEYPILLAGLADKAEAAQALPALDRVVAFPTTVFLHRDGRVRAVDSGFSGPATGAEHARQRARFERLIEELIAEEDPSDAPTWTTLTGDAWRDERDGVLVHIAVKDGARSFEAYELLRFDRETRRDPVAHGAVAISGTTLRLGDAIWHHDRRAGVFLDARDVGHRLVPAARSRIPVVDGKGHSEVVDLRLALSSSDPLLRREALHYMALQSKDGELEEPFDPLPALADADVPARTMAAWACGHLELPAAEPGLIACLAHPNAALRREAARALSKIGTPSARAPLKQCENDLDPLVREAARRPPPR